MSPKFSVIIPTYNREDFVRIAVESVLNQTFRDFELIVVDDGSTDDTRKIMKGYNPKVKYIYQQNKGPSSARNRGIQEAQGDYMAFLDSDDRWIENKLEEVNRYITTYPDIMIFHTQERWYKNGKIHNPKKKHRKPHGRIFKNCLRLCSVSISTAVVNKIVFEKIGNFDESLPVCEDYDFWIRASLKFYVFLIEEVLTLKEGGHSDQLSRLYGCKDKFRIKSMVNLIHNNKLSFTQFQEVLEELGKKCEIYGKGCVKRGKIGEGKYYLNLPSEIKNRILRSRL